MFCWDTFGPGIHVDAIWHEAPTQTLMRTKRTLHGNGDPHWQRHPLQDRALCHTAKAAQELPRQCDKELKALTWPPHCPAPNPVEHLQEAQPCSMHKAKYLLPTPTSQTPQDDPRGPVSMQSDPQWASIDHSCLETSTWVAKPKVSPEEHLMVTRLSLLFTLPFSDFNVMADRCINVDHSHSFQ